MRRSMRGILRGVAIGLGVATPALMAPIATGQPRAAEV